jgi:hypothetical protein
MEIELISSSTSEAIDFTEYNEQKSE